LSEESPNQLTNQIALVKELIEALKRQRDRFGRLIYKFRNNEEILDKWTEQSIEVMQIKKELSQKSLLLPENEVKLLKQILDVKTFDEYDAIISESLDLMKKSEFVKISDIDAILKRIDELIVDLMVSVRRLERGDDTEILRIKNILVKRVVPIWFASAVIGIDIPSQNWVSIISGILIIYSAAVP